MKGHGKVPALLLALALLAAACGGGGGSRPGPGDRAQPAPLDVNDVNPVAREALADGGTFRWPLDDLPPNFNHYQADGLLDDTEDVISALLPWTFHPDARGEPLRNADLLESAELTAVDPQQAITYRINPKAVWDDGAPITWRDFEAQWQALSGADPAYLVASTNGYNRIASVVQGTGEREVVVTFRERYADWEGLFSPLYPASTMSDPSVFNAGWVEGPLTTAGPFRFGSVDRTAKTITLVRNERWWGAPAKLERIIYRVLSRDAQIDALANGELDWVLIGSNVNNLRRAQATPGVELRRAGGPNYSLIALNGTSDLLTDVRVRRALAMALDRETITRALIGPLGVPTAPLNNHIFMANQQGYEDNASKAVPYDPQRAGALLDEVGWRRAGGSPPTERGDVRTKDGTPLALRYVIDAENPISRQVSELVQGMLRQVGVRVNIEAVPSGDFFQRYVIPGNFDIASYGFVGTAFPISSTESLYANPQPGPDGLIVQQNYGRVGSAELDAVHDRAMAELDPVKAAELANQVDAMIWELASQLPTYQRPDLVAVRSNVANFGAFGLADPAPYAHIGFTEGAPT